MEWLLVYVPALACVGMMLVICLPMMRKMSGGHSDEAGASSEEVAELREEVARLRAERALDAQREVTHG